MRRATQISAGFLCASLGAFASAHAAEQPSQQPAPLEIHIKHDNSRGLHFFEPAGLHIQPGQSVRFVSGAYHHTITAYHPDNGKELRMPEGAAPFDESLGEASADYRDAFIYNFSAPGTYDFFCRYHEAHGEVGRIVVGSAGGPASNPPGYAGAPSQPIGFNGLSSALLLPRVQQVFDALNPASIVQHTRIAFPAERIQPGVAWHPLNPTPITIQRTSRSNDPFAGHWTLDPTQSKFPGAPPTREDFYFEVDTEDAVRFRVEEVRNGATVTANYSGRFDGRDYPMTGAPGRDSLAMARIDDHNIMGVYKHKGRVTYAFVRSLSSDALTMTTRVLGSTELGQPVDVLIVHRKQSNTSAALP